MKGKNGEGIYLPTSVLLAKLYIQLPCMSELHQTAPPHYMACALILRFQKS